MVFKDVANNVVTLTQRSSEKLIPTIIGVIMVILPKDMMKPFNINWI
jgi:hypothetical protein